MELSLVSTLSAREARIHGAVVPTSMPAWRTPTQSLLFVFQNTLADSMFGNRRQSASPATSLLSFLIWTDSGSMATSRARGPSPMQPGICPRSHILASMAPSMQAGIESSICSDAAMNAIFGFSIPNDLATPSRNPEIFTFWRKSGRGTTAISLKKISLG